MTVLHQRLLGLSIHPIPIVGIYNYLRRFQIVFIDGNSLIDTNILFDL